MDKRHNSHYSSSLMPYNESEVLNEIDEIINQEHKLLEKTLIRKLINHGRPKKHYR